MGNIPLPGLGFKIGRILRSVCEGEDGRTIVGSTVGSSVGIPLGSGLGTILGTDVGRSVGMCVG